MPRFARNDKVSVIARPQAVAIQAMVKTGQDVDCRAALAMTNPSSRSRRLHLQPPGVQQRLGVAAGLLLALEHQLGRGLVGRA